MGRGRNGVRVIGIVGKFQAEIKTLDALALASRARRAAVRDLRKPAEVLYMSANPYSDGSGCRLSLERRAGRGVLLVGGLVRGFRGGRLVGGPFGRSSRGISRSRILRASLRLGLERLRLGRFSHLVLGIGVGVAAEAGRPGHQDRKRYGKHRVGAARVGFVHGKTLFQLRLSFVRTYPITPLFICTNSQWV